MNRCEMVRVPAGIDGDGHRGAVDILCGKPALRHGCCCTCFLKMAGSDDFTLDELEALYPKIPCRDCADCDGESHHWLLEASECDEETGVITVPCKHCDATAEGVLCEECTQIVPSTQAARLRMDDPNEEAWRCEECEERLDLLPGVPS